MKKISIDLGYGDIKVCTEKGEFKFTNAISFAGHSSVDYNQNALDVYKFNDIDYLVGEQALLNKPFITRDYGYLYEYAPLLVYKALKTAKIKPNDTINLVTGLSLKDWHKASEFGERICDIFVNNEHYKISPENIKVVPQGKGVYLDYKSKNNIIDNDFFAIVDIGFNTFDFLIFKDGKPIPNKNYANTLGVNTLIQELQIYLNKEFRSNFSEQDCKDILFNKSVRIGAKTTDLTSAINKEIFKYSKILHNEILAKNADLINKVFKVVISGGGAYLLKEINANIFDHQVYSTEPFEFANVRGYYEELKNEQ
jgi:plasmid segregation protein ParM